MASGSEVFGPEALRGMFRRRAAMNRAGGSMRRVDEVVVSAGVRRLAAMAVVFASMFLAAPSMAVRQQSVVATSDGPPGAIGSSAAPVATTSSDGAAIILQLVGVSIGLDDATGRLEVDRDQLRASLAAWLIALGQRGSWGLFGVHGIYLLPEVVGVLAADRANLTSGPFLIVAGLALFTWISVLDVLFNGFPSLVQAVVGGALTSFAAAMRSADPHGVKRFGRSRSEAPQRQEPLREGVARRLESGS